MRTPAGKECQYFYGDYYRGRQHEECRLLQTADPPIIWRRELCTNCPVPDILRANACSHMILVPRLERPFPFIKQQVSVQTIATAHSGVVLTRTWVVVSAIRCHPNSSKNDLILPLTDHALELET